MCRTRSVEAFASISACPLTSVSQLGDLSGHILTICPQSAGKRLVRVCFPVDFKGGNCVSYNGST